MKKRHLIKTFSVRRFLIILTIICLISSSSIVLGLGNTKTMQKMISENYELEKYYNYDELTELLEQLQLEYSEIYHYSSIGKTWEGRDIWLVKISDNVEVEEEEAEVLWIGGMHGDEKQGYETVIYTIKSFLENYTFVNVNESFTERVRNVVNNTEIYIFPMLNPDGVEARTRKNARPNNCPFGRTLFRGVDINRNSGYKWELQDKYPFRFRRDLAYIWEKANVKFPIFDFHTLRGEGCYRGPEPFSEPESKAIKHVFENNNISIYVDHHAATSPGMILYGWGWNHNLEFPNEALMSSIAQGVVDITNYNVKNGSVITYFGGLRDWITAEYGALAFAFELPSTIGDKPLLHFIHENGVLNPKKATPIIEICKTHVLVSLYFAERAMLLNQ